MNMDEMPAGREMDALVDANIMGFPQCVANHAQSMGWCMSCNPPIWTEINGIKVGEPTPNVRAKGYWPYYSTDIAAAWEVLRRLYEITGFQEIVIRCFSEGDGWQIELNRKGSGEGVSGSQVKFDNVWDCAPLAICRAALKVMDRSNQR